MRGLPRRWRPRRRRFRRSIAPWSRPGRGRAGCRSALEGLARYRARLFRGPSGHRGGALVSDPRAVAGLRPVPGAGHRGHPPVHRGLRVAGAGGHRAAALAGAGRRAGPLLVAGLAGLAGAAGLRLVAVGRRGDVPDVVVVAGAALSLDAVDAVGLRVGRLRGAAGAPARAPAWPILRRWRWRPRPRATRR